MTTKKNEQLGLDFFPALTKYDMNEVKIEDKGLQRYINIDNKNIYLGGIFANKMFGKSMSLFILFGFESTIDLS